MIQVLRIRNIFERPEDSDPLVLVPFRPGLRIADVTPPDFDLEGGNVVLLNSRSLSGKEVDEKVLVDGDALVLGECPGWFLPIAAQIILAKLVIVIAVSAVLSFGIAMLSAPKSPTKTAYGDKSDGPARNFEGIQDTTGNGRPIPFAYGRVRTGGQFLQSFERALTGEQVREGLTTLHTLMGVALGPVEKISGIQINGMAIETIPDVTYEIRLGTADQEGIVGFDEIVHELIRQEPILEKDGWQTYITTAPVEALEITFRFPQGLFRVSAAGQVVQFDVSFDLQVRLFGSDDPFTVRTLKKTCSASSRNPVKSQVKIEGLALGIYELKIRRTTADDVAQKAGELNFSSTSEVYAISEITYEPQAHPGLAMVGLKQLPSEQLNASVPTTYTFLLEGFNDVRIYSDLSTFTLGWSENPAWCAAHFITGKIHGLGDKYDWDNIHLGDFLAWAAYCDELVDDGKGGKEKRATFGHIFDAVAPAEDLLAIFAQGSGAMLIKRGNLWRVVLDQVDSMVWVGSEGNISPGSLKLSFLPASALANRIQATFVNSENDYQRDSYFDELPDLLPGDPYVEANRELWGVTRITQVAREVRRLLLHNKTAITQVELEAGLDAIQVTAGSIFGVGLVTAAVGIASGRLLAVDSSGSLLRLDEEVTLEAGKTYEIVVQHGTGAIDTKRIVSPAGTTEEVAVSDIAWTGAILPGDIYSLGEIGVSVEQFRCTEVSMTEDFRKRIRGLRYDPVVYTDDLEAIPTPVIPSIPDPRKVPPDVEDLAVRERQEFAQDGTMRDVLDVDWTRPISAILDHFEVWLRAAGSLSWERKGEPTGAHFTIAGVLTPNFAYEVAVVSVSSNGVRKSPDQAPRVSIVTLGLLLQPPNLVNLQAVIIDGTLIATVDPVSDADLGPSGVYEWRRGSTWNQSSLIDTTRSPRIEIRSYSHGTATILAKAVNSIGNKSPIAASTSITLYGQIEENIVLVEEEDPTWPGTLIGFVIEGGTNKLSLVQPAAATAWTPRRGRGRRSPHRAGWGAPAPSPRSAPEGTYTSPVVTVSPGSPIRARADIECDWESIYIGLGTFDAATFAFDSPQAQIPFDGLEGDEKVRILIQSRYSQTDASEGSFTPWADHRDRGEMLMAYFQFRVRAVTDSPAYSAKVNTLRLTIDVPDKTTSGRVEVLSAVAVDVTYPAGYFVTVMRLLATLIGGAVGDEIRITAESGSGFTAEIRDSGGALTTGTFHYEARGY
jgi:predicted phage tail protein